MPTCKQCNHEKHEDDFYKGKKGKCARICKACKNANTMEWVRNNPSRRAEIIHNSYAKKIGKHPDECRHPPGYGKRTEEEQKLIDSDAHKKYYRENKISVLATAKAYAEKNKESIRAYQQEWTSVEENRERKNKKVREWRKNNPARVNELSNSRRARKLQAQPKWLNAIQLAQISEMYDVAQCRSMQTGVEHHVDHIFPLHHAKLRGLHVPWNLQVIQGKDNQRKHQNIPPEFQHMLFSGRA